MHLRELTVDEGCVELEGCLEGVQQRLGRYQHHTAWILEVWARSLINDRQVERGLDLINQAAEIQASVYGETEGRIAKGQTLVLKGR